MPCVCDRVLFRYRIGEVFLDLSKADAEARLANLDSKHSSEATSLENSIKDIKKRMDTLRTSLYSKFKNSINLELE